MLKLSDRQQNDLESVEYFVPKNCVWGSKTDEDVTKFFEFSDKGLHKEDTLIPTYTLEGRTYFHALYWGKIWRGRHMELYEEGILSGDISYASLLGMCEHVQKRKWWQLWKPLYVFIHEPTPRSVVNFMKKEMFKGIDADTIENCYQYILSCSSTKSPFIVG